MKGFLFDNDGVLIDSSELHWQAWQLLMQEDPTFFMTHEKFVEGFGKRNDLILQDALPGSSSGQRIQWATRKEELFRQIAKGTIQLLSGIEPFLKVLQEQNVPRIIASSTPIDNLKMFLSSTILGLYFDAFVSAEQVAHGKPFPDVFLAAAKRLGFPTDECVVIEDAPAGIEAGKRAGCFVVALETTHQAKELGEAHLLYKHPKDLDLEEITQAHAKWHKKRK